MRKAKLKTNSLYGYKREDGEMPVIIGVYNFSPCELKERPVLQVMYLDGVVDYVPMSDVILGVYEIV